MRVSKIQKLLERIRRNPRQVRFEELDKILLRYGFTKSQPSGGSSHYIYVKGTLMLVIPFRLPHIKAIYVERAIKLLEGGLNDEQ